MPTEVKTKSVEIKQFYEDERGNRLVDAVVNIVISSPLGQISIAAPVDGTAGTDHAIKEARALLQRWAVGVSEAIRSGYSTN